LAVLPAAFHPPTLAHLALARAALDTGQADEVILVLPAEFPHKRYETVDLEQRLGMLEQLARNEPRFSVAVSGGGLFLEIARECRAAYGEPTRIRFLCGRDAAERIVNWDYRDEPPIERQLDEFELLVAPRGGVYVPPPALASRIAALAVGEEFSALSSSEVRRRIRGGEPWRHLVPETITEQVAALYAG
jgi:nicotinate (nicotinamide) nucleotide adenylyltransferase